VAVGAEDGVGVGDQVAVVGAAPHHLGEVLEIHLVADAGAGGHDAEVVERLLAPAQEGVPFAIASEFQLDVAAEGLCAAKDVDHDRVVDDEIDGLDGLITARVAAECGDGVAHGGEVDDGGHAGEVLHEDAGREERDLAVGAACLQPGGDGRDLSDVDGAAVLVTEQISRAEPSTSTAGRVRSPSPFAAAASRLK